MPHPCHLLHIFPKSFCSRPYSSSTFLQTAILNHLQSHVPHTQTISIYHALHFSHALNTQMTVLSTGKTSLLLLSFKRHTTHPPNYHMLCLSQAPGYTDSRFSAIICISTTKNQDSSRNWDMGNNLIIVHVPVPWRFLVHWQLKCRIQNGTNYSHSCLKIDIK